MHVTFVRNFPVDLSFKRNENFSGIKSKKFNIRSYFTLTKVENYKILKTMALFENKQDNYSKQYLSWLSENNVYVSSKSTWGRPPHPCIVSDETIDEGESSGRGLIAFKNIQQNEKIIEIPENIIITEKNDFYYTENHSFLNEYDRIAIFLIRERSKGKKSFWKAYLDTLPTENDLRLVFRWKLSDIIFLKGSKILLATNYLKKK